MEDEQLGQDQNVLTNRFNPNPGFGLATSERLTAEGIIRACFANPDRKKYHDFGQRMSPWMKFHDTFTMEMLLEKLRVILPTTDEILKSYEIRLSDVNEFYTNLDNNYDNEPVDVEEYLSMLRNSTWSGPYKLDGWDWFYFFSVDGSGSNQYHVRFGLQLDESDLLCVTIGYYKNGSEIRQLRKLR